MLCLGTVPASTTIYIPFATYDGATGASETCSGLAVTDIEIYKNGSATQRASDAGYTLLDTDGIDFDGITGINGFSVDLSDNTDAGFYAVGSWYWVVVSSITADSQTVNFVAAVFRIGPAEGTAGYQPVDVARISNDSDAADNCELMFDGTGYAGGTTKMKVDVDTIKTQAVTCAAGVTVLAQVGAAGAPGAANGLVTTNGTKVNQTVDLTAGQSIACSDKTGFSLAATGADLILKSSTFIQAIVAAVNEFATYGLTALNTLLVTTGIKVGSIANNAITANAINDGAITNAKVADDVDVNAKTVTAGVIAADVWNAATSGYGGAGTYGQAVEDILADTNELQVDDTPTAVAAVKTVVDAVKVQTDKLTFTVANQVDANIQYINDTAVTGDGGTTPWGPA